MAIRFAPSGQACVVSAPFMADSTQGEDSPDRSSALAEFDAQLRALGTTHAIATAATALVAEQLGALLACYYVIDERSGSATAAGVSGSRDGFGQPPVGPCFRLEDCEPGYL